MRQIVVIVAVTIFIAATAFARDLRIVVTAADTGLPLEGVAVSLVAGGGPGQQAVTAADGVAAFTLAADLPPWVKVTLLKADWAGVVSVWQPKGPGDALPDTWSFALAPATRVGGRVVDEAGRPLAGARVVVRVRTAADTDQQRVQLDHHDFVTGVDGRWTADGIPAACKSIEIAAWHHECLPEQGYYNEQAYEPQAALRDGSATLTLTRGTPLKGVVRDTAGKPVAGAKVYYNASRDVGNAIPPVTTDADGAFALGVPPGTTPRLVVEKKGFAPALSKPLVGNAQQSVKVTLPPPSALTGRVIDGAGRGVAGAFVFIRNWHGQNTLGQRLQTDADGQFAWNDAPADAVTADVYGDGLVAARNAELKPGEKNEVRLLGVTSVALDVFDAETGRPVKDLDVRTGIIWNAGERVVWQSREYASPVPTETGVVCKLEQPVHQCVLRVETDGYYPADTPAFTPDGRAQRFALKLERGTPLAGRATLPGGKPAGVGKAYFVHDYLSVQNGNEVDFDQVSADVAADGTFTLRPQREKGRLILVTEGGVGRWNAGDFEGRTQFDLQPWASVSGRIMVGDRPLANAALGGSQFEDPANAPPAVRWSYDVVTDADGRFKLDKVWPGRVTLRQYVSNRAPRRSWAINVGAFDARAGQDRVVQVGGTGRPVVGRLAMAFGDTPWMRRVCEAKSLTDPTAVTPSPTIGEDGRFRIEDVPAGEYALTIALHEWPPDDTCGWGRALGEYHAKFTVPPVEGGGPGEAVDVGTLASTVVATEGVRVGDVAPEFSAKTLDGATLRLADLKGEIVLLDFWATWCAPCMAELPHLKKLRDAYREDARFVLVGMNADEQTGRLQAYLKAEQYDWPQALLGPDSGVAKAYGATAIPATVLIGSDGRVIARDLRGDALRDAVDRAMLHQPRAATR